MFESLSMLIPKTDVVQIETEVRQGDEFSVHYDPMIANIVVCGSGPTYSFAQITHLIKSIQYWQSSK